MIEAGHGGDLLGAGIDIEEVQKENGITSINYIFPEVLKNEELDVILDDQKESFDEWFDYLLSADADFYPMWVKYWVFTGMVDLGKYNKDTKVFSERTRGTVAPFVELNEEALSYVLDSLEKKYGVEYFRLYEEILSIKNRLEKAKKMQRRNKVLLRAIKAGFVIKEDSGYELKADLPSVIELEGSEEKSIFIKRKALKKMAENFVEGEEVEELEEILMKANNELLDYFDDNEVPDDIRKDIVEENFGQLYAVALEHINPIDGGEMAITEGEWVCYYSGSDSGPLVKSLKGKGTGWCTAGERVASEQLQKGDFHVYYSNDSSGAPTNPRIAIRMEGKQIVEVRGVAGSQHLDQYIVETDILETKLEDFPDKGDYEKKHSDMAFLTEIIKKSEDDEELSKEELMFIYEIESSILGFGRSKDPRIDKLLASRESLKDYLLIFDCTKENVARNLDEIDGSTKILLGGKRKRLTGEDLHFLKNLEFVENPIDLFEIDDLRELSNLLDVGLKTKNVSYDYDEIPVTFLEDFARFVPLIADKINANSDLTREEALYLYGFKVDEDTKEIVRDINYYDSDILADLIERRHDYVKEMNDYSLIYELDEDEIRVDPLELPVKDYASISKLKLVVNGVYSYSKNEQFEAFEQIRSLLDQGCEIEKIVLNGVPEMTIDEFSELTDFVDRVVNNDDILYEDLCVLYGCSSELDYSQRESRIERDFKYNWLSGVSVVKELRKGRNIRYDIARIFKCYDNEVALSEEEITEDTLVFYGDLSYDLALVLPKIVYGSLIMHYGTSENLGNLEEIHGSLILKESTLLDIGNLKFIRKNVLYNNSFESELVEHYGYSKGYFEALLEKLREISNEVLLTKFK